MSFVLLTAVGWPLDYALFLSFDYLIATIYVTISTILFSVKLFKLTINMRQTMLFARTQLLLSDSESNLNLNSKNNNININISSNDISERQMTLLDTVSKP